MNRLFGAIVICLLSVAAATHAQTASVVPAEDVGIYGIIPSVTSSDTPPIVFDADRIRIYPVHGDTLANAWRSLAASGLDISLSPELAASLLALPSSAPSRRFDHVLDLPFNFDAEQAAKYGRVVSLLSQAVNELRRVTKLEIHLEPVSRLYPRVDGGDLSLQYLVLATRSENELAAALNATIRAEISNSQNIKTQRFPTDSTDLIKMWLKDRLDPKDVLLYDSHINLIVVRTTFESVKGFMALWSLSFPDQQP